MPPEGQSENLEPSWLTENYLERVLTNKFKEGVKVESYTVKRAVPPGSNFISLLLRVTVKFTIEAKRFKKNLIVKVVDSDPVNAQRMDEHGFYKREIIMFGRILPKISKLLHDIGDNEQIAPEVYAVDYETQTLIFEDLKERHFEVADCKTGIDQSHVDIILRKLVKLHACSMVLKERNEETFEEFNKGLMVEDRSGPTLFFELTLADLVEEMETWDGCEIYTKKLKRLQQVLIDQGVALFKSSKDEFNVLNHGDLWTTNFMFQYDNVGRVQYGVLVGQLKILAPEAILKII